MTPKVRIVLTGHGRGDVFIDGQKVEGIHTLTLSCSARQPAINQVTLHLHAAEVEVDGPIDVTIIESEASEVRSPHLPAPMPVEPPIDRRYPTAFAWRPVPLFVFKPNGEPENHWPHPCWSRTGRWAWLTTVQFCENVVTGERFYFAPGDPQGKPFSAIALEHWRAQGVDC